MNTSSLIEFNHYFFWGGADFDTTKIPLSKKTSKNPSLFLWPTIPENFYLEISQFMQEQ